MPNVTLLWIVSKLLSMLFGVHDSLDEKEEVLFHLNGLSENGTMVLRAYELGIRLNVRVSLDQEVNTRFLCGLDEWTETDKTDLVPFYRSLRARNAGSHSVRLEGLCLRSNSQSVARALGCCLPEVVVTNAGKIRQTLNTRITYTMSVRNEVNMPANPLPIAMPLCFSVTNGKPQADEKKVTKKLVNLSSNQLSDHSVSLKSLLIPLSS
ncbi:hypothetical protein Tco_0724811 [Tanacetum coccineum]|uniref:Uncharacterized protein n=1 Tax=Tanacetum coccineum TaxID=301880 RepID=A0ABQ4YBZ5_9ASTR